MATRYDQLLEAILSGRKVTRGMINGDPYDNRELPPMVDEPNQGEIDAEQARRFREAVEAQNQSYGGGE